MNLSPVTSFCGATTASSVSLQNKYMGLICLAYELSEPFLFFDREVLVMEFIEGTPIMNLSNEMSKRGIDPGGKLAAMAKQ